MDLLALPLTDPVAVFGAVLLILFLAPMAMERLRIPGMVGLLLAGALLGPGGFNLLARKGEIELLGSVGLVYIMFLAGLEIDLGNLRKNRGHGIAFGIITFLLPFLAGMAAGRFLLGMGWAPSLLFGSVFSSHTLITLPLVQRLGLNRSRPVLTAIMATIVTDGLAMLVLALVTAGHGEGAGLLFWLRLILLSTALCFGGFFLLPRLSSLVLRRLQSDGITEFIFVLAALFILAFLSALAGLEPIIGAFIAGVALNPLIPEKSALMNRISFVGNSLFIPFFLVSTGMLADYRAFGAGGGSIQAAILMIALIFLAKGGAALAMRPLARYSSLESGLLFGLTVNQAAATLAAVLVGHELGFFGVDILNGTIAMIVATCLAGPLATGFFARRIALAGKGRPEEGPEAGTEERIMVMVANPERSGRLMDLAVLLRPGDSQEPLYPVNIVRDSADAEKAVAASEKLLAQTVVRAVAAGVDAIPVTRMSYNVAEGVLRAAEEARVTTIVVGAGSGSQLQRRPYGRVIDQLVRSSRQMVLVERLRRAANLHSSVVVVLPPLCERQSGFRHAAGLVKTLVSQISAKLQLITLEHGAGDLISAFEQVRPTMNFHAHRLRSWADFRAEARKHSSPSTIFALMNVRQGALAWQPAVDRLPSLLLEEDPATPILCVYLPDEGARRGEPKEAASAQEGILASALADGRFRFWKDRLAMADAIRSLLAPAFTEDREAGSRLCSRFMEVAQKEPVELKPGILLLHAHVSESERALFFFGLCPPGIPLLSVQEPVKLLLVLVAPQDQPPEEHLQTLSRLASEAMDEDLCAALLSARNPQEVKAALPRAQP